MDPVSTVKSLCTLAASIYVWIDQSRQKEATLVAIAGTVSRISCILAPFEKAEKLEPLLTDAFLGLGDALSRTKEHLVAYGKQRRRNSLNGAIGFFAPSQVTALLNQDEQDLTHQLTVILFALATVTFFRDRSLKSPECFAPRPGKSNDTLEFWKDYIGAKYAKVLYARTDRFLEALRLCFGNCLSESTRRRLSLRLDEFKVGGITFSNLERFVGDQSLEQAVAKFVALDSSSSTIQMRFDTKLPLLIWVDDKPENNIQEVAFAKSNGVNVLEFGSTALAKIWMEENEDDLKSYSARDTAEFLRQNDTPASIRFISDTARLEADPEGNVPSNAYLNISAGENIARFLRGHQYRAPLLIFCDSGIIHTRYVESYEATGSTCDAAVVRNYILALKERSENDWEWEGYNLCAEAAEDK
ncbi:hypothetical protein H0H81_011363 [Sphagnurus paluster]|uniref:Uncharacterized protein n=1 Tax=Sphagnurus paluster TaxID=117069 RepID=A0A9P7GJ58_9AGAR|nr:hypothetical protein H0H81_011363 [Sphagnurus paluster]